MLCILVESSPKIDETCIAIFTLCDAGHENMSMQRWTNCPAVGNGKLQKGNKGPPNEQKICSANLT